MTLFELDKLQKSKGWKEFRYLTENQPHGLYAPFHPVTLKLDFNQMTVSYFVDVCLLLFKGDCGTMQINLIQGVNYVHNVVGDILTVQCQNGEQYIFVAR